MRARTVVLFLAVLLLGAIGGSMLTPPPADAVSREIIQIQQTVNEILQNQQDLRTDLDTKVAGMQTLVQQSLDASGHLNQTMARCRRRYRMPQRTMARTTARSRSRCRA